MRESIVLPAWKLLSDGFLKKYNFFPSFLSTIYLMAIILYQLVYVYIGMFGKKDQVLAQLNSLIHSEYIQEIIIGGVIFILLYSIAIPICEAGLIELIDSKQKHPEKGYSLFRSIIAGLKHFLPLYEAQALLSIFKFITLVTFSLFLIRLLGKEYLGWILLAMGIYFFFSVIVNILFSYTRYFIILDGKNAFEALSASFRMSLQSIDKTTKIYITLFLVYTRTIIIACIIILLPFILSSLLTLITLPLLQAGAIIVFGCLFFGFTILISHLNSVLDIFIEGLWYYSFIENKLEFPHEDAGHHEEHH